jgi:hypothetical protein
VLPPDRLPRANALDAMTFGVSGLAGPALAGTAAQTFGAPSAVVVSVALIALALPAALRLPARPRRMPAIRATSVLRDLAAGTHAIAGKPALARATLTTVISCAAQGMLMACIPLLGEHTLGSAAHGAALLSCAAVSALAANAALARFPHAVTPDTIVRTSAFLQAAAPALAVWGRPAALIAALVLAGAGEGPQLAALFAVRHREAPEHLRSQIFTTGASLKITGFALGAAVAGPLGTWSLPATLVLTATVAALAALAPLAVPAAAATGPHRSHDIP